VIPAARRGAWEVKPNGDLVEHDGGENPWMVDTPDERRTHRAAADEAIRRGGQILTTGLGLAVFPSMCLESAAVECVTIVERNAEVVDLVWPTVFAKYGNRVHLVVADAWEYTPTERYSVIWHDVWLVPFSAESRRFREVCGPRYAEWCDWQGFWECA